MKLTRKFSAAIAGKYSNVISTPKIYWTNICAVNKVKIMNRVRLQNPPPNIFRLTLRMRRVMAILILVMSVFLAGCHKPQVEFTDMRPTPTATVSNNAVTVHLGWAWRTSADYVHAKSKIKDQTVYVYGYYTMKEPSPEYAIKLPASVSTQTISIVWMNPDGSTAPIPFTK